MSIDLINIALLNIHDVDYPCKVGGITQGEALNLLRNADVSKESGSL